MSVSSWFYKKTSKSTKKPEDGELHNELMKHSQAVLASGNLRLAVTLPEGEDKNEWLAVNTVDFFHQISMIYGTISEWCTIESCPVMSAGPKYEYHWADGKSIKRAIRVPACQYVEYLTSWVQSQLEDDRIFPVRMDAVFAPDFEDIVKQIFRRLFRVYAHIYHSHFSNIILLGEEAHLNTSFKHFIYFVKEFNLIEEKELGPLSELIECLRS